MHQTTFEIHLRGELPQGLLMVAGARREETGSETLLLTRDLDQRRLHELVARLRDLGVVLLELRRTTGSPSELQTEPLTDGPTGGPGEQ